ncbi:hypothetical protein BH09PSE5_BH09PSE5_17880 [soil metagenome]
MACKNGCVADSTMPGYCRNCAAPMGGGGTKPKLAADHPRPHPARPPGVKCLNIHGHGARFGDEQKSFSLPPNVEVGFWVFDTELYSIQLNSSDLEGNPRMGPVDLHRFACPDYFTWSLDPDENGPAAGPNVKVTLAEAIAQASHAGGASWKVNTSRFHAGSGGPMSLESICAAIGQHARTTPATRWRVNWLCCREAI